MSQNKALALPVAITGLGMVSPLGLTVEQNWANAIKGVSGLTTLERYSHEGLSTLTTGEVKDFNSSNYFTDKQSSHMDRVSQYACVAAVEAIEDAGIDPQGDRTAVVLGSGAPNIDTVCQTVRDRYVSDKRIPPLTIMKSMANAPAANISMEHGITGPSLVVSTACASANHAMIYAYSLISSGVADVVITGGCEASLTREFHEAWQNLYVLSKDTCRPFSKNRSGMVLSEGAGIVVMESLAHAKKRSARIHSLFLGGGMSSDAGQMVAPDSNGMISAMNKALSSAGLSANDIDLVSAHGTGTQLNDKTETIAIKSVFDHDVAVTSTKSFHGHALGASAAFEAILTSQSLCENIIPPTINYDEPDENCNLNIVANSAREESLNYALSNSFAFGGTNSSIILQKAT